MPPPARPIDPERPATLKLPTPPARTPVMRPLAREARTGTMAKLAGARGCMTPTGAPTVRTDGPNIVARAAGRQRGPIAATATRCPPGGPMMCATL